MSCQCGTFHEHNYKYTFKKLAINHVLSLENIKGNYSFSTDKSRGKKNHGSKVTSTLIFHSNLLCFSFCSSVIDSVGISFLGWLDIKDFKRLQPKSGFFEQSRVVQGTAMPARREGRKPTSNKENLDTKKLLLYGTKTRICNDLVNLVFSPLDLS